MFVTDERDSAAYAKWNKRFPAGMNPWMGKWEQEAAFAALNDTAADVVDIYGRDYIQAAFPDVDLDNPGRIEAISKFADMYDRIAERQSHYNFMIPILTDDWKNDVPFRDNLRKEIVRMRDDGVAGAPEAAALYKELFDAEIDAPSPDLPDPDPAKDYVEAPDPTPADPEDVGGFRDTLRNLADEFFRGRSKRAKRGVGNLHLADRYAFDKDNNEVRKGDVVWFDAAPGKGKRPAADGYIQNIVVATEKDADGNRRPKVDAAGNPIISKIVVRHFDPSYIGKDHVKPELRKLGHKWPFPYMDFEIANPAKVVRFIPDENPRAQAVIDQFGLHGRRMAGRGAGRFAPIVGKVFRLDRMRNAVPIQNRFLRDKTGRLVGEGDVVRYNGNLYEVIRPNNPWDNAGSPRVMIRPVGGGDLKQPVAHNVEFVDEAKDGQLFFRGAGGIAAPKKQDIADALGRQGIWDRDLADALVDGEFADVAKAIAANEKIQEFLDKEAADRKKIRDRIEIDNRGRRIPPGHRPVGELEYLRAQDAKADAVVLLAAKGGFFADDDGKDRDLPEKIRKDLYGEYVGAEADVAMRSAYNDLFDAVEAVVAGATPDGLGTEEAKELRLRLNAVQINAGRVGNARLNDTKERSVARDALTRIRESALRLGNDDLRVKADALMEAIDIWGNEFDERQGAVPAPAPGGAPARPRTPTPTPPPAAEFDKSVLRGMLGKGNAFINPDAKAAINDILADKEPNQAQIDALRADIKRSIERYKGGDGGRAREADADAYQGVLDALDARWPEGAAPPAAPTPAPPRPPRPPRPCLTPGLTRFRTTRTCAGCSTVRTGCSAATRSARCRRWSTGTSLMSSSWTSSAPSCASWSGARWGLISGTTGQSRTWLRPVSARTARCRRQPLLPPQR